MQSCFRHVKLLHQESDCSTKPEFIMGHSFQAVAVLVSAAKSTFAVPLASRIHEGVVRESTARRWPCAAWTCCGNPWESRFGLVDHPTRGKCILISTDLSLDSLEIIRLYGLRFKIELSFEQAVRRLGTYAYHFWMRDMKPFGDATETSTCTGRRNDIATTS